jgi:hypothetical protein
MNRTDRGTGWIVAAVVLVVGAVATPAAEDPYRVAGEIVASTDDVGRLVFAVDAFGDDGLPDGQVDELYLLAPEPGRSFEIGPRSMSGVVVWSKAGGFVAAFDGSGVERWALTTSIRPTAQRTFRGVELVRVVGGLEGSPWTVETSRIASVLTADPGDPSTLDGGADGCQSGGVGATGCSRKCTTVGGLAGGTACDVTCGAGYYACCRCEGGLVARCTCRLAARPLEGEGVGGGERPSPCFPDCKL